MVAFPQRHRLMPPPAVVSSNSPCGVQRIAAFDAQLGEPCTSSAAAKIPLSMLGGVAGWHGGRGRGALTRDEATTDTEDNAIARPAAHGGRRTPTG